MAVLNTETLQVEEAHTREEQFGAAIVLNEVHPLLTVLGHDERRTHPLREAPRRIQALSGLLPVIGGTEVAGILPVTSNQLLGERREGIIVFRRRLTAVLDGLHIGQSSSGIVTGAQHLSLGAVEQYLGIGELLADVVIITDAGHAVSILEGRTAVAAPPESVVLVAIDEQPGDEGAGQNGVTCSRPCAVDRAVSLPQRCGCSGCWKRCA